MGGSYKVTLVARGFEQTVSSDTDFYAGTPKLSTLRALLTIAAIHGNPVAFGELQPIDIRLLDECEETCRTIRRFDPPASHG